MTHTIVEFVNLKPVIPEYRFLCTFAHLIAKYEFGLSR
jgi:hypothetical protein